MAPDQPDFAVIGETTPSGPRVEPCRRNGKRILPEPTPCAAAVRGGRFTQAAFHVKKEIVTRLRPSPSHRQLPAGTVLIRPLELLG
jgi:hypothetical protein